MRLNNVARRSANKACADRLGFLGEHGRPRLDCHSMPLARFAFLLRPAPVAPVGAGGFSLGFAFRLATFAAKGLGVGVFHFDNEVSSSWYCSCDLQALSHGRTSSKEWHQPKSRVQCIFAYTAVPCSSLARRSASGRSAIASVGISNILIPSKGPTAEE